MLIDQTSDTRTVQLSIARTPAVLACAHAGYGCRHSPLDKLTAQATRAHLRHRTINRTNWRGMGEVCLQSTKLQPKHKADVSPDLARTTSPIASFRPAWDHLPVVRRCN